MVGISSKGYEWSATVKPIRVRSCRRRQFVTAEPGWRSYAQELARHVDAFFPSIYTFDDNISDWKVGDRVLGDPINQVEGGLTGETAQARCRRTGTRGDYCACCG